MLWTVLLAFSKYMLLIYLNINILITVFTAGMVQILTSLTETWTCNLKRFKLLCRWMCLLSLQKFKHGIKIAVQLVHLLSSCNVSTVYETQ